VMFGCTHLRKNLYAGTFVKEVWGRFSLPHRHASAIKHD
jgi:hypothetical protein